MSACVAERMVTSRASLTPTPRSQRALPSTLRSLGRVRSGRRSASRRLPPLAQLLLEPFDRVGALALGRAVQLHEAQEQVVVRDPPEHVLEPLAVEPAGTTPLAPDAVGPVVELERGQKALVVGVALGEATGPHRVVVLAGPRTPLLHFVLERVMDQHQEPQQLALLTAHALASEPLEQVLHVVGDGPLGMALPRLPPSQPAKQLGILSHPSLELGLGPKPGNEFLGALHRGIVASGSAGAATRCPRAPSHPRCEQGSPAPNRRPRWP